MLSWQTASCLFFIVSWFLGSDKLPLVELLISHGAQLNSLTARGYTPLDRCVFHYVIGNYNKEILKLLVQSGAHLKPLTSPVGYVLIGEAVVPIFQYRQCISALTGHVWQM